MLYELGRVRDFIRGVVSRPQREKRRLRKMMPKTRSRSWLVEPEFEFVNPISFLNMYEAIFERRVFDFEPQSDSPRILDCGANIGLSVVYFKQRFPQSRIVAFEPDVTLFEVLQGNVERCVGLDEIDLVQAAVWNCDQDEIAFMSEGDLSGRAVSLNQEWKQTAVRAVDLLGYLDEPVDLLKIDIEGAELPVLRNCRDKLAAVRAMFVEYHGFKNEPQSLSELLELVRAAGFRYCVESEIKVDRPLINRLCYGGMDVQLNVYAYRA